MGRCNDKKVGHTIVLCNEIARKKTETEKVLYHREQEGKSQTVGDEKRKKKTVCLLLFKYMSLVDVDVDVFFYHTKKKCRIKHYAVIACIP